MQVEAIPMLINGDFLNAPLDVKMHLADYKMYGEDSYVFQQKELLHGLYECTYLSMNDRRINREAFEYLTANNKHVGKALSNIYDIEQKEELSTLTTMREVAASSTAMQAVADSSTAMQAVAASSTAMQEVAASSTAMQAVAASSTAMQAVLASSTAIQAVAASSTAMQAVADSSTAMQAVAASSTAMQAVADSSTAMQAVAASSIAMQAVAASSTAMQAVIASSTAMRAVAASSTATQAVAASSTAMQAVLTSSTAIEEILSSSNHNEEMFTIMGKSKAVLNTFKNSVTLMIKFNKLSEELRAKFANGVEKKNINSEYYTSKYIIRTTAFLHEYTNGRGYNNRAAGTVGNSNITLVGESTQTNISVKNKFITDFYYNSGDLVSNNYGYPQYCGNVSIIYA